jgi:serine protease Do
MDMQTKNNKRTGKIIFIFVLSSMCALLLLGTLALGFLFFRYVQPNLVNVLTSTMIQNVSGQNSGDQNIKDIESTSIKHFSIEDAALLPDGKEKEALSVVDIVKKVSPATVAVRAEVSYSAYGQTGVAEGSGTGFIISEDGYIVTNHHVIEGAEKVEVLIPGQKDYVAAEIVGYDAQTDMAVLQVDEKDLPFVTMGDSDSLEVGELAVAIGNPFGDLAGTVTVGVISAQDRTVSIQGSTYSLLQTDASINSGNSGGPLVNSYGEVIGITNAKVSEGEGIGFAIPVNAIKTVIEDIVNNGYVKGRPLLGVSVITVDAATAETYGWPTGAYVRVIVKDGAADLAGIEVGDIIVEIEGSEIVSAEAVSEIRNNHEVGDEISVVIFRNGETMEKILTLQEATS